MRSMADSTRKTSMTKDETGVCRKLDFRCCGSGIIRYCKKLMLRISPTPTLPRVAGEGANEKDIKP